METDKIIDNATTLLVYSIENKFGEALSSKISVFVEYMGKGEVFVYLESRRFGTKKTSSATVEFDDKGEATRATTAFGFRFNACPAILTEEELRLLNEAIFILAKRCEKEIKVYIKMMKELEQSNNTQQR